MTDLLDPRDPVNAIPDQTELLRELASYSRKIQRVSEPTADGNDPFVQGDKTLDGKTVSSLVSAGQSFVISGGH